jgi:hypothetical protein
VAVTRCAVGLDLGKLQDFSALALVRQTVSVPPAEWAAGWVPGQPKTLAQALGTWEVPTLHRWPLGTAYTSVVADVVKFLGNPPLESAFPVLVVDETGVGQAVAEAARTQLVQAGVQGGFVAATITAGAAVSKVGEGRWRVSKKQLVSTLQVLLGNRRLHVAPAQPEARTLVDELGKFTVKVTPAMNESFESWRDRDHDDLVLAVALACWALASLRWPESPPRKGGRS